MAIPSDLEDKLAVVRGKISFPIEHWLRICPLTERIVRHREAAAPALSGLLNNLSAGLSSSASVPSSTSGSIERETDAFTMSSIFSGLTAGACRTVVDGQADLPRLTNTVKSLVVVNERCLYGEDCELCAGLRQGLVHVSADTQRRVDALECAVSPTELLNLLSRRDLLAHHLVTKNILRPFESLKGQRDFYVAMRDLFIRHDKFSLDLVDRLRKRVDTKSHRLEGIRQDWKEGWEQKADRIIGLIEKG